MSAFVVVVITFMQLLYRVMRVTLTEGLGDFSPLFRNVHVTTLINMAATFILVMSGTFIYIFQLFGAANQLMASLSLIIVTWVMLDAFGVTIVNDEPLLRNDGADVIVGLAPLNR